MNDSHLRTIAKRSVRMASRTVDQEAVIVEPRTGTVHVLNEVASLVWNSIDGNRTVVDLSEMISEVFDVQPDQVSEDVYTFLRNSEQQGLVEFVN